MIDARYRVRERRGWFYSQRREPGHWFWRTVGPWGTKDGWKTRGAASWFCHIWRKADEHLTGGGE